MRIYAIKTTRRIGLTYWLLATLVACIATASAQRGEPHLGYVYPAGGKQGTTIRAVAGGQFLRGAYDVYISGEGVTASVIEYVRALDNDELGYVATFLRNMVKRRWSIGAKGYQGKQTDEMVLPDHPWLRDLDEKTPREIARLRTRLFDPKKQPNAQIAEQVEIEITIDPDAQPGYRDLRIVTPGGLTNPVRFEIGDKPEAREEDVGATDESQLMPMELPVVINGQIMPGEVDNFWLRARKGQHLVFQTHARRLIPYLADAVPGWFQATIALYDSRGNELAYADDYRFDPDPVLDYLVPETGLYRLQVRDALYRGREDFVYRIAVGELPFITSLFPLGGQLGHSTVVSVAGWNLPNGEVKLDTAHPAPAIRELCVSGPVGRSNEVSYAVDTLAESLEVEPNDTTKQAQQLTPPVIVNGRIGSRGDVDTFAFQGRADEEWVAEVWARRLGSPVDSLLRLIDSDGNVLASNDDHNDPEAALLTHQADAYVRVKLPRDGIYQVQVMDTQRQGGDDCAYRLHLRLAQPDFSLRVTPSGINMPARRPASLTVHAIRKDGFAGDIEVVLKQAPAGFTLSRTFIPADKESVETTLQVSRDVAYGIYQITIEGRAQIAGQSVTRLALPAEDMMQAFAYHHLVPQQELLVAVTGSMPVPAVWRPLVPGIQIASSLPLRIPLGGTAQLHLKAPDTILDDRPVALKDLNFSMAAPARGVYLREVSKVPGGVIITLKADANIAQLGEKAHIIIEATAVGEARAFPDAKPASRQRITLGVLPAVPFEIVRGEL